MIASLRKTYADAASNIPGWETMNKNDLCNLYVQYEGTPKGDQYLGAIMCRYWNHIYKFYSQSYQSFTLEDCYDWLVNGIEYALRKRKWLEEGNSMYNDPNGPDKIINRCLASARLEAFQSSNTDKRRGNFAQVNLDKLSEDLENPIELADPNCYIDNYIANSKVISLVQTFINQGRLDIAIIIDGICFADSFKEVIARKVTTFEFNERKLVSHLISLDDRFKQRFLSVYYVDEEELDNMIVFFTKKERFQVYPVMRRILSQLKTNGTVRRALC